MPNLCSAATIASSEAPIGSGTPSASHWARCRASMSGAIGITMLLDCLARCLYSEALWSVRSVRQFNLRFFTGHAALRLCCFLLDSGYSALPFPYSRPDRSHTQEDQRDEHQF